MTKDLIIRECKYHGSTIHVYEEKGRHVRCAKCRSEAVQRRRSKIKLMAIEYKGGKCSLCGYNKCVDALDFHHLDPNEKEFALSVRGLTRSWDRVKTELDKCELLCANCHREVHHKQSQLASPARVWLKDIICKHCGNTFAPQKGSQMYCSNECRLFASRKVSNRPDKERLQIDIESLGYCGTGRKYGVTDNTIRKWLK